ncbi:MAG: HAMP domain-containing sensor histidine kinase [Ekhidna sp.]
MNNLTHEIKTPIASISLATSMLKNENNPLDEDKKSNYLNLIDLESKRLEGQVDKVLQIAMIDSGNFTLEKQQLDVHEVIGQVIESVKLMVSKRNGNISLRLNATKPTVFADRTHLLNIIYNLIDNALKYTVDVPEIAISTSDHPQGIEISIKDNGIGIGEEIQSYIFDKFYRAESGNIQNAKGFGLGLSYVKKIIEEHKGTIALQSKLNQGSEFRLYFPFS